MSPSQVRWSSSSSKPKADESEGGTLNADASESETRPSSSLASAFGFQSLSGLFSTSTRSRYEPSTDDGDQKRAMTPPVNFVSRTLMQENQDSIAEGVVSRPPSASNEAPCDVNSPHAPNSDSTNLSESESLVRNVHRPKPVRKSSALGFTDGQTYSGRQRFVRSVPIQFVPPKQVSNPFVRRRRDAKEGPSRERPSDLKQPWGLSVEESRTIDSITEPGFSVIEEVDTNIRTSSTLAERTDAVEVVLPSPELSHVNRSGEAHMVDVGRKSDSRRVAIAYGAIRFNNPEPFRLIFENSNKKGDVLSVSRIAGVMAAKRTSDLIPLCHPITISKVEVDVKLRAPGVASPLYRSNDHGVVTIQVQVEATGPTGVEMEALTATSAAALTVYDMCKAVDREMRIGPIQLVYKCGGKSGLYCNMKWIGEGGRQLLREQQLETPEKSKPGNGEAEKKD